MPYIDTHAHLYDKQFVQDLPSIIQRCNLAQVQKIYMPNIDETTIEPMLAMAKTYPKTCFPMLGLHPCAVQENATSLLNIMAAWLTKSTFSAMGEIGLDLFHHATYQKQQIKAFETQLSWAQQLHLPVSIHCRQAEDLLLQVLKPYAPLKGVWHCFGGTLQHAQQAIDLGLALGIGGIVTFKKNLLTCILPHIPYQNLVLETDSPYLAPMPFRGKRNEPSYLPYIAATLANLYQVDVTTIAEATTHTALDIFDHTH